MSNYDDDYFFIRWDEDTPGFPFLTPDDNTNERRYAQNPPPPGSAPLIFSNGFKDEFKSRRVKDVAADILFDGAQFMVSGPIRDKLLKLDLPHVHLHPAVYIDDSGNWHEDYWFVGITKEFDCWDRDKSTYDDEPIDMGDESIYSIFTYSLNAPLLDKTPLPERLLFKMGGTMDGLVTCHKSIAGVFRSGGKNGAVLQPIKDY